MILTLNSLVFGTFSNLVAIEPFWKEVKTKSNSINGNKDYCLIFAYLLAYKNMKKNIWLTYTCALKHWLFVWFIDG